MFALSTKQSNTSNMASPAANGGLPAELELARPFLWATEDLRHFATASKACRDAAYQSCQKRIAFPYGDKGQRSHVICNCHKEIWQDGCASVLSKALVGR